MVKKAFILKSVVPTIIVFVSLVVALNVFLSARFSSLSNRLINEKLEANVNSLDFYLEDSRVNTRTAAITMALNPEAVKAIRERDINAIAGIFAFMQNLYPIHYFTICDHEGTVLTRTYEFDSFGDSILYQQSIEDALNGRISTYFETGTLIKLAIRTGAPVYDEDGELVGVVTAGIRLDTDGRVEELRRLFDSEVAIFLGDTRIATTVTEDGRSIVDETLDPHIARAVMENRREYSGSITIPSGRYAAFYMPLLNAQEEAFATFFLGIPEAETITALNKTIRDGIILGICGLAVSVVLLFFILSSLHQLPHEPVAKA